MRVPASPAAANAAIPGMFFRVVESVVVNKLLRRLVGRNERGEGGWTEGVEKKSRGGGLLMLRCIGNLIKQHLQN